jgi:CHASE3 domain sensor protein
MAKENRKEIEEKLRRFLKEQGVDVAQLDKEGQKAAERLKELDRALQSAQSSGHSAVSAEASFQVRS